LNHQVSQGSAAAPFRWRGILYYCT